jgi:hypothetical protein
LEWRSEWWPALPGNHPTSNINAIVRANLLPGTRDALHPPWRGVLGSRHPCTLPQRPFCWNTLAAHPVIPSTSFTSQPAPQTSEFTSAPNQHRLATPISYGMDLHVQPRRCFVEPFGRRCIKTSLAALQKGTFWKPRIGGRQPVCNPGCLSLPRLPC